MTDSTALQAQTPPVKLTASPAKVLQDVANKKISGRLTIGDPNIDSLFWRVYLGNGQVHFATSIIGQPERLSYLLDRYFPEIAPDKSVNIKSDYHYLCQYWQSGLLSLQQVRKALFALSQDALVQLLALPQGVIQFEKTLGIDPLLLSVPLQQVLTPVQASVNRWIKLRSEISSPFQRPLVIDTREFEQLLQPLVQDSSRLLLINLALSQNLCLYEAAGQLKTTVLELATLLQPLVKTGAVGIRPYTLPQTDKRPLIVCIDDSRTVQGYVQIALEAAGYRVMGVLEPRRALTDVVRHKPALILMDICMPEIDGYELSRQLRQSPLLRDIPIVMLTGRDGLIDRFRARMVGANEYITKPFHAKQLLTVIRKKLSITGGEDENSFSG